MAKGRKRKKGNEPGPAPVPVFGSPDGCWGRPPCPGGFPGPLPRPMGPLGPRMPGERFPMRPPDFRPPFPPMMEKEPFIDRPPEFIMRGPFTPEFRGEPGFHPRFPDPDFDDRPLRFNDGPRFPHPDFDNRPPGFLPPEFEGGPRYPHPEFDGRPRGFPPREFEGPGPRPGFYPPPCEGGPGFHPAEFEDRLPGFVPLELRGGPEYPVDGYSSVGPHFRPPGEVHDDPGFGASGGSYGPPADFVGPGQALGQQSTVTLCPPPSTQNKTNQQASKQAKTESTKTTASKSAISTVKITSEYVKPPPGRFLGVISFIGNNYGYIEREDLKKFSFSFDAFFGKREHLVAGVKVHFTAVKELGKECATDVKVAPGGTTEIEETVYEGVVITPLPDTYVMDVHPGRIRTILSTDPIKLPFGKKDSKCTLLLLDRVKFQVQTDILSKNTRATNITPQIPETFQLTKEVREKGVIMNVKNNIYTIMSKKQENLSAPISENLSDHELNVMDEVEFTAVTVRGTVKAIRLKKLPDGSVVFDSQTKNKIAEVREIIDSSAAKDKWKPVTSEAVPEEEGGGEDISSEKYEGTVFKVIPKKSKEDENETEEQEPPHGLLDTAVVGTLKRLPFRSVDVITQATMLVGDKVCFNICINNETKEERAVNIEIQPETFQTESSEQRKTGVILKLNDDDSGYIRTPQDPQLFFDMNEVMETKKLTLCEKVEFSLILNEGSEKPKQAIRVRRLTQSVFTSARKLESLGEKEKKKMTIKLLKEPIKTENKDSVGAEKSQKGQGTASKAAKSTKGVKPEIKGKQEKGSVDQERSRSRESSRRRSRSRSSDRTSSYYRKHRSSSRERSYSRYRRSRSHSRERSRKSRSRSRSRDRNGRSGKKRSRSPKSKDDYRRRRSSSKERKSPDKKSDSRKKTGGGKVVDDELSRKRKELLELNELIARKRAIIAMEQNTMSFKGVLEMDRQHGFATFDYQHKTCLENTWTPDLKPAKSILKKHSDLVDPHQSTKSLSPEEPEEYKKRNTSNPYAKTVPHKSSSTDVEEQELEQKKKLLQELSESIARKRAIVAMEQKAKAFYDGPEIKKEYDFASCSEGLDITSSSDSTWRVDIKPDPQPKKSILKKRTDPVADQLQSDMTSTNPYSYGHSIFPHSKPPQNDYSSFSKPSGPSQTIPEKSTDPPNTINIFQRLIKEASSASNRTNSSTSNKSADQSSFLPASKSGAFCDPKNEGDSKASCSYENTSSTSYSNHLSSQAYDKSSVSEPSSSAQSSTLEQNRNRATQMQRFLGALNKADSNLLSSLLREARKDSDSLGAQKNPQVPPERKKPSKDELYDPFKETEDNEDTFSMESKQGDDYDDDLLPHERAVQDGSGFSRIVGMQYGAEAKLLYNQKTASTSQSRLSEEQKRSSEHDQYNPRRDSYSSDPYFEHQSRSVEGPSHQNPYSHTQGSNAENRERYERQEESERYKVGDSLGSVHQKGKDTSEVVKRAEQFEKIQSLLQTIGLKLDTAEVSKLADRTRERLYGKKVKPQSASSRPLDQKHEQSSSTTYDRRGSRADSSDSEGVKSVSPARSSNREVYMSYLDSVRFRDNRGDGKEVVAKEKDLANLKRTIKNSPEARKATTDSYKITPPPTKDAPNSYKPPSPSASPQTISVLYSPADTASASSSVAQYFKSRQDSWESSYSIDPNQKGSSQDPVSPYGSVPLIPLHYAASAQVPNPHIPPGYGSYPPLYPVPPPFNTPLPFGPPPTPFFPLPVGQFNRPIQLGSPNYASIKTNTKTSGQNRCLKTIETVSTKEPVSAKPVLPATQSVLINIQAVEESSAKDTPEEDTLKQAVPLMEDDIKAKQKKRLEQFNQRMRLKKEQQMEALRTRGQSQKSAPGKLSRQEVKNVWICGHSLVFWAEKRATSPEFGMQLGMDPNSVKIWWKGVQGMTWQQLLPQLFQLKDNWPKPDVILMHLGGNDIGKSTPEAFLAAVKKDLTSARSIFPECLLVWSDILPRKSWRHSSDSVAVENARKALNNSMQSIIGELGGCSLSHENIKPGLDTGLYRPDGVHLSGKGIDTFNLNMQDFLERWESEVNEAEPSEV